MPLISKAKAEELLRKWVWEREPVEKTFPLYVLKAKECRLEIYPRPHYCDRGEWEMHAICPGFPKNPNPVDHADLFPRLYFILVTAQFEGVLWMDKRKYTPLVETTEP